MTCLIRELSSLWSWLKLRLSPLAAVYSFTGNETRPNVIWPFQIVAATRIPSPRAALSPQHQQISAESQTFSSGCVGRGKQAYSRKGRRKSLPGEHHICDPQNSADTDCP